MLDAVTIENIAARAARKRVSEAGLERVVVKPAVDSEGKDALRITFVLTPRGAEEITGDAAVDLLVALQQELAEKDEERSPLVEYATERDIAERELAERDEAPEED